MSIVDLSEWFAAREYLDRMVDRANMYVVREAGRQIRGFAREDVPVYTGNLRRSISNSRRMRNPAPHEYSISVGPHGAPMYKYSGIVEGRTHFMETARDDVAENVAGIMERAQRRVLARFA